MKIIQANKFIRALPVLLLGALILFTLITTADESFALITLFLLVIGLFFIVASIITYVKDSKIYRATKSLLSFLPTIISLFFITTFIIINYLLVARDISPVIIKATHQGSYGSLTLYLKEDGTYKLRSSLLGDQNYRGTYHLEDHLIIFNKGVDHNILSKKLIIQDTVILNSNPMINKVIYETDDKGQVTDKSYGFNIELYDQNGISNLPH